MQYDWNNKKDEQVQRERGVSFNDVVEVINEGQALADLKHPNQEKYDHQRVLVVKINNYAYAVPYVIEQDGTKFFKTLYPDRNLTKKYLS